MAGARDVVVKQSWGTMAHDLPSTSLRDGFIDAMSRAVTGVTIVTTDGELGRFGQTVSAMTSVSADPPMLLVCINRKSPIRHAISEHRVFAVNVLRSDQRRLADTFAGRPRQGSPYDFGLARWSAAKTGAPLLSGAIAQFECALEAGYDVGTHTIYIGNVVAAHSALGAPLVYSRRGYGELHAFPHPKPGEDLVPMDFDDDARLKLGDL
jgi:flavin reductase